MIEYLIGSAQSRYAGIAIFFAILAICIAILFTNTDISIGNRIGVVIFVILMSIFPVMISLFELTCIVTGAGNKPYNLCNMFAWFIAAIIIIYCFILIIMTITSMFTYKKALTKVTVTENFNKVSPEDAHHIAQNMLQEAKMTEKEHHELKEQRAHREVQEQKKQADKKGFEVEKHMMMGGVSDDMQELTDFSSFASVPSVPSKPVQPVSLPSVTPSAADVEPFANELTEHFSFI